EKWSIVHTTERVDGVRAIADYISVELQKGEEIARVILDRLRASAVLEARKGDGCSVDDPIKIHVQHGWVILKGTVHSKHTQAMVDNIVRRVAGGRGLSNRLKIKAAADLRRGGKKNQAAPGLSPALPTRGEERARPPAAAPSA